MAELKPCPFCGGPAWLLYTDDNHKRPYVQCQFGCFRKPKCPVAYLKSWEYKTEEEAIEAWNRRELNGRD